MFTIHITSIFGWHGPIIVLKKIVGKKNKCTLLLDISKIFYGLFIVHWLGPNLTDIEKKYHPYNIIDGIQMLFTSSEKG